MTAEEKTKLVAYITNGKTFLQIAEFTELLKKDREQQIAELKKDLKECIMVLEVIPEEIVTKAMNKLNKH